MGECSICGEINVLTRHCNYCSRELCTEHTLPENHDCLGLDRIGEDTKHLQSDISAKLDDDYRNTSTEDDVGETTVGYNPEKAMSNSVESLEDSGPDVAPDGSLVHEENELDAELDRIRREATGGNARLERARITVDVAGKRLKAVLLDLRLWFLLLITIGVANYAGYLNLV